MSKTRKRVAVLWEDSVTHETGWQPVGHAVSHEDIMMVESVGFLLKSDRKQVILCHSVHLENVSGVISIPRSAVRSIIAL